MTETKAVKLIEAAKAKALKNKKLNLDPADKDALYAYIWANDADIKKNDLQGFRRDTIELNMLEALYKGKYDETTIDTIVKIPYGNGKEFEIEVNNDYKTSQGIRVPLFEARAPFESYLSDLNQQALVNLIDREQKLEHYAGLKVGDIYFISEATKLTGVTLNGSEGRDCAPHIISLSIEGIRAEVLLHALEDKGIYVSSGSACASNRPSLSGTLTAMGINRSLLDSTLRFSLSVHTTRDELDYTLDNLGTIIPMLRKYTRH